MVTPVAAAAPQLHHVNSQCPSRPPQCLLSGTVAPWRSQMRCSSSNSLASAVPCNQQRPTCSLSLQPSSYPLSSPHEACKLHRHRSSRTGSRCLGSSTADAAVAQPELCVIVDENNNVVGAATRKETVSQRLLGRGAYVLLFNSSGQLFVSKRSPHKDCYPGCLDVTISGVVNYAEEYVDTAVRELQEEVSIPASHSRQLLQQLFIFPYQDSVCHVFGAAFRLVWDGPVAFADAEVEWGRFVTLQELQQQLQEAAEQFTPVGRHILQLYFKWEQEQEAQQQPAQRAQQQQ